MGQTSHRPWITFRGQTSIDQMITAKGALPVQPAIVHDTLRSYERSWDDYLRFGTV